LDEADHSAESGPRRGGQWVGLLLVWLTGIVLLHVVVLVIGYKVARIFIDFKVRAPLMALALQVVNKYSQPVAGSIIVLNWIGWLVAVVVTGRQLKPAQYRRAVWLSAGAWFTLLVLLATSYLVPLIDLMRRVSGGK
jgi:hypothetical protein